MKKIFDVEWNANRNYTDNKSVVSFSAVARDNPSEEYAGTMGVSGTDDAAIEAHLDANLVGYIRAVKERMNEG